MKQVSSALDACGWALWIHSILMAIAFPHAAIAETLSSSSKSSSIEVKATNLNPPRLLKLNQPSGEQFGTTTVSKGWARETPTIQGSDELVQAVTPYLFSQALQKTPPKLDSGLSTRAADLSTQPNAISESLLEFPAGLKPLKTAQNSEAEEAGTSRLSPLERPMTRLFGFETPSTLQQYELVIHGGLNSLNSPINVLGDNNRDNNFEAGLDFGITDKLQLSVGVLGRDDTEYSNLARNPSSLQFIYGGIPVQAKYQVYNEKRFSAAVVVGAEFPTDDLVVSPAEFVRGALGEFDESGGRKVIFTTNPQGILSASNALIAEDNSIFASIAAPISYQLTDQVRLHLNPQASFFPGEISVTNTRGSLASLTEANVGFNGSQLDYFGTVVGLGIGADYSLHPRIKFAADLTPILVGQNSIGSGGEGSLFIPRLVWNAGLQAALNSRLGLSLYATNRFTP
ncbi:MAG TPA: hypothetical protein V6D03_04795, partial [Candidatus Caenarcaniphilales bacterium]